jgi:methyltransferase (TIGR00027 family)
MNPQPQPAAAGEPLLVRNISDTARWIAAHRARETRRPDAVFRDPLAEKLAGERGFQIADAMSLGKDMTWPYVARTYLIDRFVEQEVSRGADVVVNLAAGLDTRPYRMHLPARLKWVEVDLPEILQFKEEILRDEKPACSLERLRLDLSDMPQRRKLFADLGRQAQRALIISEGLLIYLTPNEVSALAVDLAAQTSFQRWIVDIASPGLLAMLQKQIGAKLTGSGASLKFAPVQGPFYFQNSGWSPADVQSVLKTARRLRRLPFFMSLLAVLPESSGAQGSRPWSGICLLANQRVIE